VGESSFRVMDNFSQGLTFSFTKSSVILQSFLLYISLRILFSFSLSVHRRPSFFLFQVDIFFLLLSEIVSIATTDYFQSLFVLLTCSPFFLVSQTKFFFTFLPFVFVFVFELGLLGEGKETGRGQQVAV